MLHLIYSMTTALTGWAATHATRDFTRIDGFMGKYKYLDCRDMNIAAQHKSANCRVQNLTGGAERDQKED